MGIFRTSSLVISVEFPVRIESVHSGVPGGCTTGPSGLSIEWWMKRIKIFNVSEYSGLSLITMGEKYDTLVLGAGTAGLSAGIQLKKAGRNYIILDAKKEIGKPIRSTGAVSVEWVEKIGMPTDPSIVLSGISGIRMQTETGVRVDLKYNRNIGLVYDFEKYEKYLANNLEGKLNISLETKVTDIKNDTVSTDQGEFRADNIIMALGPQSKFGKRLDRKNVLVAYEEIRELPRRDDFEMVIFFSDMAPGGYIWDFPNTENSRKIGVCFYPVNPVAPKTVLAEFTKKFPEIDGPASETMAHQIPLTEPSSTVIEGNRAYVGDMVNAVLNTTAGGLQGAFWSGKEAGIAAASGKLSNYQERWDEDIRPWLMKHHRIHDKMHRNGVKTINSLMRKAKLMPKFIQKRVFGGL